MTIQLVLDFMTVDMLTFECQVTGGVSTVWNGSAFMCPDTGNEINLLHSRFDSGTSGTCNDINNSVIIVGESIEVNGSEYTSQLNISFSSSSIGKTVNCVRDDGLNDSVISNYTIPSDINIIGIIIIITTYFCHTVCTQITPIRIQLNQIFHVLVSSTI